MKSLVQKFIANESGATAIEYGLIAGLIAVAVIGAITSVGSNLKTQFNKIATAIS
ncbi:MAG: Flp pilus assembly protein pilin Flp [Hyphomicrobiales bacterium]|nr:Flp pilus assembly protein pilin Flp [Hyphomicrobiales bacterium]